ncbi:MAG: glycosyltransferase [Phycisphaerales bacterium]|nr:glycosyltransferase [Phycisphaerales bacterium]MCB9857941.1 glycosyltransferase [Phycisphaerales bacterium]
MTIEPPTVSLVIPGRNCATTIRQCLEAAIAIRDADPATLREIIFVDDGSTDGTAAIVAGMPVTMLPGTGTGPGAARNLGWRAATSQLVWFVDADCVAELDALARLLPHMAVANVGGVSGSYGTMTDHSLLSCLIHEEIIERHRRMGTHVNFLATFNVLYRRAALETVGGFDERFLKGQDAELSFRVMSAGYQLRFEIGSRVKHYHPTKLRSYLRTQRQQGYWRLFLHVGHKGHAMGDSYSGFVDHAQPPLAMLVLATLPLLAVARWRWICVAATVLLAIFQVPMTWRLIRRTGQFQYVAYAGMSFLRAFWRGVGLSAGAIAFVLRRHKPAQPSQDA